MASRARVGAFQMAADIAGRREVSLRVNRRANHGSDIPKRQVLLVIETRQQRRARSSYTHLVVLVAAPADCDRRQVVVLGVRGLRRRGMARNTCQLGGKLEMQLVREWPRCLGRGRAQY